MLKAILLVEDNPNDLELTLYALERSKLLNEVVVARDGEEALHYLQRKGSHANRFPGNPAVVLLDLKLPKIDGLDVLRQIRGCPTLKTLPVVMLTASNEDTDRLRSYDLGVNAYVVKPLDFKQFVQAVAELGMFWAALNEPPPGSVRALRAVDET